MSALGSTCMDAPGGQPLAHSMRHQEIMPHSAPVADAPQYTNGGVLLRGKRGPDIQWDEGDNRQRCDP